MLGENDYGQLNVPQGRFKDISVKSDHTCALSLHNTVSCWGEQGFTSSVPPSGKFSEITTGSLHGCAIRQDDRKAICWGNNAYGQTDPVPGKYKSLVSGNYHTCGLTESNDVICWGNDEHGQKQVPDESMKSIAGGGELTCGLNKQHKIWCRGSYAYNHFLFEQVAQSKASASDGETQRLLPFTFLADMALVMGTGLVNYGKGADKEWKGSEAGGVKWQLGLAFGSILFNALNSFLPVPESKTERLLKEIQAKLKELSQELETVRKDVQAVTALVSKSFCNQQLQVIQVNVDTILNSTRDYRRTLDKVEALSASYKQGILNPMPEINSFVNQAKNIEDARDNLVRAMKGSVTESPLLACLKSANDNIKAPNNQIIGLDDRALYLDSYRILDISLMAQANALIMLQDINAIKAVKSLVGAQAAAASSPIKLVPEDLDAICQTIRTPSVDPKNPRWLDASGFCNINTESVKKQYADYVSQIELIGAPYTDDFQVLTMSKDILGYGSNTRNLLWVRNNENIRPRLEHRQKTYPEFLKSFGGSGDIDLYFQNGTTANDRWLPAGNEWMDLFRVFVDYSKQKGTSLKYDLLEKMSTETDQFALKPYFSGVMSKVFWMTGQTYVMDWRNLVRSLANIRVSDGPVTQGMKCFVASGINKTRIQEVSGMVCSEYEMEAMTNRVYSFGDISWKLYPQKDEGCGSRSSSTTNVNYCIGNGPEFLNLSGDANLPRGAVNLDYLPYSVELGSYFLRWYTGFVAGGIAFWGDADMVADAWFFPNRDKGLYVMPVLDVSKLQCLDGLTNPGVSSKRAGSRLGIPSRCGKDFDRVIKDMVPRPDSNIPGYSDLDTYVRPLRTN